MVKWSHMVVVASALVWELGSTGVAVAQACSPDCPENYACEGGMCVEARSTPSPFADESVPQSEACVPSCRTGYVCVRGGCVTACNPPCGAGELCSVHGECLATEPAGALAPPLYASPPPANSPGQGDIEERRALSLAARARRRAVAGWIGGFLTLGLGIASAALNDEEDVSRPLGGAAMAVALPFGVIAGTGGRALRRMHPDVRGIPALRVSGWILLASTLVAGAAVLGISFTSDVPSEAIIGLTVAGVLGVFMLTGDAMVTHRQARRFLIEPTRGSRVTLHPVLRGNPAGAFAGLGGSF